MVSRRKLKLIDFSENPKVMKMVRGLKYLKKNMINERKINNGCSKVYKRKRANVSLNTMP